jgi:hypothetical protein
MAYRLAWLATVLRAAGLSVVETPGWQSRGRAEMGEPRGVLCHHTAGPLHGEDPSLETVLNGRPDLPGPLSQLFLARSGTWHVLAAGRCNHAGAGSWHGVTAGNSELIGVEAENAGDGRDLWPVAQLESYARGVAAILTHIGADSVMAAGHKEFALPRGRKVDPSFDMIEFREQVAGWMKHAAPSAPAARTTDPTRDMLRKGDQGRSVGDLQALLGLHVDEAFGPVTESAVKAFQSAHGLKPDGLVGPATWRALGRA